MKSLEEKPWWGYLEKDLQELLREAMLLTQKVGDWDKKFDDYSFVVFPASKAYEGFLKKLFLDMDFITQKDYFSKRFRIGKSLNPFLPKRLQGKDYVYDELVGYCGGEGLANKLWDTWKTCRNILFHWFPNEERTITFEESKQKVKKVINSIDAAFTGCKIEKGKRG